MFLPPYPLLIVKRTAMNPDRIKISFDVVPLFYRTWFLFIYLFIQCLLHRNFRTEADDLDVCETIPNTSLREKCVCARIRERVCEGPWEDQRRNLADSSGLNDQRNKRCSRWRGESFGWYSIKCARYGRIKHASDIKRASLSALFRLSANVDLPNDSICLSIPWFIQKTIRFS